MLDRAARAALLLAGAATQAWWPPGAVAQGCAMCKTALEGANDPLTQAFNTSVLFLMAMPYVVVGTIGGWIYLASRRRDGHRRKDGPADAGPSALGSKGDQR